MKGSYSIVFAVLLAGGTLTACGGGGGASSSVGSMVPVQSGPRVALQFSGTTTLARHTLASLSGTAVTVSYNGNVVGSGTLDAGGAATIELESSVPSGAAVSITAGSVTATLVLAHTTEDTAVLVQVNSDGTLTVSVAAGTQPEASPSPDDPNGTTETEDDHGDATSVDENNGSTTLPANLPVSVASDCKMIALTPLSSSIASARFEENVEDADGGSQFKYEGPFTAAMSFPLIAGSARLRIELFDAQNDRLLDLRAPLTAFGITNCATPSPSPSPSSSPST